MKSNDQVLAPQVNPNPWLHCLGQPARAYIVGTRAQRWPKSRHNVGNLGNVG
jgi:hypothetical protein